MTRARALKNTIRARAARTGERYTTARRHVLRQSPAIASAPVAPVAPVAPGRTQSHPAHLSHLAAPGRTQPHPAHLSHLAAPSRTQPHLVHPVKVPCRM